ncbi:MAG TPA: molybdopterin-dependent oxidoreductase [Opitutaceae bacterium]
MFARRFILFTCLAFGALRSLAAPPLLTISGSGTTTTLTAGDFAALPRAELKLAETHGKQETVYSGVPMRDVLLKVGAPLGDRFCGPALAMGVVVRCKDGYTVLFALAEFDEAFSNRTILLADREDGDILPPSAAPLRIISPGDKRGARSARQVVAIELVSHAPKA